MSDPFMSQKENILIRRYKLDPAPKCAITPAKNNKLYQRKEQKFYWLSFKSEKK